MWAADNIAHANMPLHPLYYDIINLTSLKIIQAFHLLLGFAENQGVFWDFKIQNSIQITEASDKRDSDNRDSTVYIYIYIVYFAWLVSFAYSIYYACIYSTIHALFKAQSCHM